MFINLHNNIISNYTLLCNDLIKDLLKENNNQKIDVIGDHGITLYHDPKNSITIQIANSQLLADLQHTPVISDFRINDVKNGRQGAPLAPIYQQALLDRSSYKIG
ncbi:MAG: anhydro-N-acetylmuramic acid kinase [Rickettsia endosymbiont of Argas persicus]